MHIQKPVPRACVLLQTLLQVTLACCYHRRQIFMGDAVVAVNNVWCLESSYHTVASLLRDAGDLVVLSLASAQDVDTEDVLSTRWRVVATLHLCIIVTGFIMTVKHIMIMILQTPMVDIPDVNKQEQLPCTSRCTYACMTYARVPFQLIPPNSLCTPSCYGWLRINVLRMHHVCKDAIDALYGIGNHKVNNNTSYIQKIPIKHLYKPQLLCPCFVVVWVRVFSIAQSIITPLKITQSNKSTPAVPTPNRHASTACIRSIPTQLSLCVQKCVIFCSVQTLLLTWNINVQPGLVFGNSSVEQHD